MNLTQQVLKWEHVRHKVLVLIFRVVLGIIITYKGIVFIGNTEYFDSQLQHSTLHFDSSFWICYVVFAHVVGGMFITVGLLTRPALFIQIPVTLGALLFINPGDHGFALDSDFLLSFVVLCMLCYFLFKGPGEISMDNYLRNHAL